MSTVNDQLRPGGGSTVGFGYSRNVNGFTNDTIRASWISVHILFGTWLLLTVLSPWWERVLSKWMNQGSKNAIRAPPLANTNPTGTAPDMAMRTDQAADPNGVNVSKTTPNPTLAGTGERMASEVTLNTPAVDMEGRPLQHSENVFLAHPPFQTRFLKVTRACRDAFLLLMATTLVKMAGYGYNSSSLVLQWVLFAFLWCWMLSQLLHPTISWIVDFAWMITLSALFLIMWGIAWKETFPTLIPNSNS